jgi:death-on-curing family protein
MNIKPITVDEIKFIAHRLAKDTMDWDEPIPEFETRFPNILESCVISPFQKFNSRLLYKGLNGKAAFLFYLLIKNHPFQNGNKRIAMTALLVFLLINGYWLKTDTIILYNTALWVARSPADSRDEVIRYIHKFIEKYKVKATDK